MAWLVFGGVVFFLMGLGLAADARGHARSALQWLPAERSAALVLAYRLAGGLFMACGLFMAFSGRIEPPVLGRAGRLAAGVLLLACGAGLAWAKRPELGAGARLPGDLEREMGLSPAPDPLGARVWRWSGWALAAAFAGFGALLLSAG